MEELAGSRRVLGGGAANPGLIPAFACLTPNQWLVCGVAALGFAFDLYETLVLPLIVRPALAALGNLRLVSPGYNLWVGFLFYLPLASGGIFGLLGGYLTDVLGRRRVLVWSILLYAFSACAASFAVTLPQLLFFRMNVETEEAAPEICVEHQGPRFGEVARRGTLFGTVWRPIGDEYVSLLNSLMSPYYAIVYFVVQFLLALLAGIISAILAYGAIAATIIGFLGPIFIPFLVFDKLDWLFWSWLKAYLGFSFYKVVAAATLNVLSHVLTNYYIQLGQSMSDPSTMVQTLPLLILLVLVNIYILFKIPTMTHSLFTGGTGGHGGGLGLAMLAIRAAM